MMSSFRSFWLTFGVILLIFISARLDCHGEKLDLAKLPEVPKDIFSNGVSPVEISSDEISKIIKLEITREERVVNKISRPVILINGKFPGDVIRFKRGEKQAVLVINKLDEVTSLHSHGIFFPEGYGWYDGAEMITECGVSPNGGTQSYVIYGGKEQSGTYWYHSHTKGQYLDGFRGVIVIEDDKPYASGLVAEYIVNVFEWYNEPYDELMKSFLHHTNPDGIEPVPDVILINGRETEENVFKCEKGKQIVVRVLNSSGLAAFWVYVDDHDMTVVEIDGGKVEPAVAKTVLVAAAQRVVFLIKCKDNADTENRRFAIHYLYDPEMFDIQPEGSHEGLSTFYYNDENGPMYEPETKLEEDDLIEELKKKTDNEHIDFETQDSHLALETPNKFVTLEADFDVYYDAMNHGAFNEVVFSHPFVPSLFTMFTLSDSYASKEVYGKTTNPYVAEEGDLIEITLINKDVGPHPFHIHGHKFSIVMVGDVDEVSTDTKPKHTSELRRDTINLRGSSFAKLRFKADNPGVWMFHCHVQWHLDSGLAMIFVVLPKSETSSVPRDLIAQPPVDILRNCNERNIRTYGNAAGRLGLDLRGEKELVPPIPSIHYTGTGIFLIIVDILAFFCGMGTLLWYGARENNKVAQ